MMARIPEGSLRVARHSPVGYNNIEDDFNIRQSDTFAGAGRCTHVSYHPFRGADGR